MLLDRNIGMGESAAHSSLMMIFVLVLVGMFLYFGFDIWLSILIGVVIIFFMKLGQKQYQCKRCGAKAMSIWGHRIDK